MGLGADGVLAFGIEDHQVGVAADGYRAFLRIETENPRRRGGDQFDEAVDAEASFGHAPGVDQAHAVLDARAAVGNVAEVVFAPLLLSLETERPVNGGYA